MPNYWLLKTEPTVYSFDNLKQDKKTTWDGVSSFAALKHIRSVKKGDLALIYHSGDEKAIVGIAQVESTAYPDPNEKDERLVVFDLKAKDVLKKPVTLAAIKAKKAFEQFPLVRIPRLSVMPVEKKLWELILKMSA